MTYDAERSVTLLFGGLSYLGDAIGEPPLVQLLQAGDFLLRDRHDHLAAPADRDALFLAEVGQHPAALHAEGRLEAAGFVVNAGMDDPAVVAGLVGREAGLFFQQDLFEAGELLGEGEGRRQPQDSSPHDCQIIITGGHRIYYNKGSLPPMRILITGGAGFIGSHLCERFITEVHHLLCVDNFITGIEPNIRSLLGKPSFTLIRHDISRPLEFPEPVDYVLHFASPASPPDYLRYPIPTMKVGSLGTHNALGIAMAKRAKFLLASTSEVYGDPQVNPQPENYWGHVNPVGPRGVYDEAKRFAEALTMAYHREHEVDTRIVRIFNTYGPRMRQTDGRAIPNFMMQALLGQPLTLYGDGSQTRSFCYITDLVEGICRLMQSALHDPVNIGNPQEMTLQKLAEAILRITGSHSPIKREPLPPDDPKVRCPEISLARRALGWEPKVGLEEGLRETASWFHQNLVDTGRKIR